MEDFKQALENLKNEKDIKKLQDLQKYAVAAVPSLKLDLGTSNEIIKSIKKYVVEPNDENFNDIENNIL